MRQTARPYAAAGPTVPAPRRRLSASIALSARSWSSRWGFGYAGGVLELFAAGGDGADPGALEAAVGIKVVEDLAEVVGVCGGSAVQASEADDLALVGQGHGEG